MKCRKCGCEVYGVVDMNGGLCMECWREKSD